MAGTVASAMAAATAKTAASTAAADTDPPAPDRRQRPCLFSPPDAPLEASVLLMTPLRHPSCRLRHPSRTCPPPIHTPFMCCSSSLFFFFSKIVSPPPLALRTCSRPSEGVEPLFCIGLAQPTGGGGGAGVFAIFRNKPKFIISFYRPATDFSSCNDWRATNYRRLPALSA